MARSGWAYGDRGEWNGEMSRYLTILGSAYRTPKLYATQGEAESALDKSGKRRWRGLNMTVAHVTETIHGGVSGGYAYRITGTEES